MWTKRVKIYFLKKTLCKSKAGVEPPDPVKTFKTTMLSTVPGT